MAGRSRRRVTHGDRAAAEYLIRRSSKHHTGALASTMAYVWDSYGLADGRLNPTSRHYCDPADGTQFHATMAPSIEMINGALDEFLKTVLDPPDHWMLEIPRVLNPGKSTSDLIVSDDGGAVLLMPMAAFGTLFRWNELIMISNLAMQRSGGRPLPPDASLGKLVTYLYAGGRLPQGLDTGDVDGFLMSLDVWRGTEDGQGHRMQIWENTVFQQSAMVLHEFGHIKLINSGLEGFSRSEQMPPAFVELSDEMAVDELVSVWNQRLADALMGYLPNGRRLASDALWYLFALQDIVNDANQQPVDKWELCVRFIYLMNDLGALDRYQHFGSAFERIVSIVGGRSRAELLQYELDCLVDYARQLLRDRGSAVPRAHAPIEDFFSGARTSMGLGGPLQ